MKVTGWVRWGSVGAVSLDMMGGWVTVTDRWSDYVADFNQELVPKLEALRAEILRRGLKRGGFWHQKDEEGVPQFEDGTVAELSLRAWGDLMAAIWSTELERGFSYVDFAWSDPDLDLKA